MVIKNPYARKNSAAPSPAPAFNPVPASAPATAGRTYLAAASGNGSPPSGSPSPAPASPAMSYLAAASGNGSSSPASAGTSSLKPPPSDAFTPTDRFRMDSNRPINVGDAVEAAIGYLPPLPRNRSNSNKPSKEKKQRRTAPLVRGTVVQVRQDYTYMVHFPCVNATASMTLKQLKKVRNQAGTVQTSANTKFVPELVVGDINAVRALVKKMHKTTASKKPKYQVRKSKSSKSSSPQQTRQHQTTTVTPGCDLTITPVVNDTPSTPSRALVVRHDILASQTPQTPNNHSVSTTSPTDISDSLVDLADDRPVEGGMDCEIDLEMAECALEGTENVIHKTYQDEKAELMGDTVTVNQCGDTIEWTVRSDVDEVAVNLEPDVNIGLTGFQFDKTKRGYGESARIDMAELFHRVSGRYMEDDVRNLNGFIMEENIERKREHRRTIKLTSPRELDVFLGILLIGRLENTTNLWGRRDRSRIGEEQWKSELMLFHSIV